MIKQIKQTLPLSLTYHQYELNYSSLQNMVIGEYRVRRELGRGSFGKVYQVMDQKGMHFALKILDKKKARQEKNRRVNAIMQRLIQSEPRLMQLCDSPNLIKCYQIFANEDLKILIMQYCNGKTLSNELKQKKKFTEREAVEILRHIINGIAELHRNSIVHRDLKSDNVMKHDGLYKIIDFGFSKKLQLGSEEQRLQNTILGTPLTMAPEVFFRKKYGLKADIWSIGMIFFQLIFGSIPFESSNSSLFFKKIEKIFSSTESFSYKDVHLSPQAHDFMRRVLKINPDQRLDWRGLIEHPLIKIKDEEPITQKFVQRHEMILPEVSRQLKEGSLGDIQLQQFNVSRHHPQQVSQIQEIRDIQQTKSEGKAKKQSLIEQKEGITQSKQEEQIKPSAQIEKKDEKPAKQRFNLEKIMEQERRAQQSQRNLQQQKLQIQMNQRKRKQTESQQINSKPTKQIPSPNEYNQCLIFHLQCLKTQFLYFRIIEPIETRALIDLTKRESIQFMYLLISRCFKNLSPLKQKLKTNPKDLHSSFSNLNLQIQRLYKNVVQKLEEYDRKLLQLENQIGQIAKDFFFKLFNKKAEDQKNKFLGGVQLQQYSQNNIFGDYTKAEQIEFTSNYLDRILPNMIDIGSYSSRIKKYLNMYSAIMNVSLDTLGEQRFLDYVERIVS